MELSAFPGFLFTAFDRFTVLAVFLTVFALTVDFMKRWKKCQNYPPGPWGLPFIGNMHQVDMNNPHLSFAKLQKKYGNVFGVQIGWTNTVILNSYETVKEALVKKSEDFADRPDFPAYDYLMKNSGEGLPFDPNFLLSCVSSNIISSTVFGERFEYNDKKLLALLQLIEESFLLEGTFWGQLLNAFPFIRHFPGPQNKIFENQKQAIDFVQEIVTEHKKSWDPNEPRDFIDAFLAEEEKMKHVPDTSFQESKMIGTILNLFAAGAETTSTTLRWALLYMMLHPNLQSKVHEEIDRVIGKERKPTLEDREKIPYTNAVIHETQRFGNVAPLSLPHQTYRDTEVMGYTIPKGTTIIPNFTSIMLDENIWSTPHQFNPGHFLNSEGKFVKPEAFIPFSAGHRGCPGEQLAKAELFLIFTSMLQRFTIQLPENEPRPSCTEGIYATDRNPLPYRLCAKLRAVRRDIPSSI
ncbi:cytochrome P450 2D15-like [Scyliorhinus canicula]|uniref:cytochrome P450 2D15-like n=1 Tax=Scyliorhinus canicula TaxID=7830 RepID=UPI0018F6EAC6|nr:cytochrome P450 2D15-like [Scyliorhinus canicula]